MTPIDGLIRIATTCTRCGWAVGRAFWRRRWVCELIEEGWEDPCWSCSRAISLIETMRHRLPRLLFDLRK